MTAAIRSSHRRVPPCGLAGGESGAQGCNNVVRTDGSVEVLLGADRSEMNARARSREFAAMTDEEAARIERLYAESFGEP